jgi:hypothetical protein
MSHQSTQDDLEISTTNVENDLTYSRKDTTTEKGVQSSALDWDGPDDPDNAQNVRTRIAPLSLHSNQY